MKKALKVMVALALLFAAMTAFAGSASAAGEVGTTACWGNACGDGKTL